MPYPHDTIAVSLELWQAVSYRKKLRTEAVFYIHSIKQALVRWCGSRQLLLGFPADLPGSQMLVASKFIYSKPFTEAHVRKLTFACFHT